MTLSFYDAAFNLESICNELDAENWDAAAERDAMRGELAEVFERIDRAEYHLADSVDKRLEFFDYIEKEIDWAEKKKAEWTKRAQRMKAAQLWLKQNTLGIMQTTRVPFKGNNGTLFLQKTRKVWIDNEKNPPPGYFDIEKTIKIHRRELMADLKAGKEIPGASIQE